MSSITLIGPGGKPYHKQIVDEKGSKIIEFDKDGKEIIISECNK